ncbi:MAG: hypothetical protein WBF53_04690 [Litorimonas sp.]
MIRAGLPISLALHGAVLFGASLAFSTAQRPMETGRIVPVELVTVADVTDIRASLKRERPEPEPEEPMQVETSERNAPEESDRVNVAPDEVVPADAVPPVAQAEPDDSDAEPVEVAEAAPTLDLDRISGLIDKSKDVATVADSQVAAENPAERLVFSDRAREGVGSGLRMTVSELDALNSAMYRCWRKPADATDLENLIVRLRVELLPGGYVREAEVIDRAASRRNAPGNPFWDVAEMRAVQAVKKCAPYDFLPADKFDQWQSLILNFRPDL